MKIGDMISIIVLNNYGELIMNENENENES